MKVSDLLEEYTLCVFTRAVIHISFHKSKCVLQECCCESQYSAGVVPLGEERNTLLCTEEYSDFNSVFNPGPLSVSKQISTSLTFAFVKHICSQAVLIIRLTLHRKIVCEFVFSIEIRIPH